MKKTILSLAFTLILFVAQAQNERYVKAMEGTLTQMKGFNDKTTIEDWQMLANQFERIGNAETKEWLPNYWAAYCYTLMGFMAKENADKDKFIDKANEVYSKAEKVSPANNDELMTLKAYIAQAHMVVDPMSRWMTDGPIFTENIEKAKAANPENPRPYILQGVSLYYTPEQFGGGKAIACPIMKKAKEKLATFKPTSTIHPSWGEYNLVMVRAECE